MVTLQQQLDQRFGDARVVLLQLPVNEQLHSNVSFLCCVTVTHVFCTILHYFALFGGLGLNDKAYRITFGTFSIFLSFGLGDLASRIYIYFLKPKHA